MRETHLRFLFVQVGFHLGHVFGDALWRAVHRVRLGRLLLADEAEALARRGTWLKFELRVKTDGVKERERERTRERVK